jgi:hypothetical protein
MFSPAAESKTAATYVYATNTKKPPKEGSLGTLVEALRKLKLATIPNPSD